MIAEKFRKGSRDNDKELLWQAKKILEKYILECESFFNLNGLYLENIFYSSFPF